MRNLPQILLVLAALGCSSGEQAGSQGGAAPEERTFVALVPDMGKSFATICQSCTLIGILGDGWAIQASLPGADGTLEKGEYSVQASYVTGPDLGTYIHPPAGPPTPPLPQDGSCVVRKIENLTVTIHGKTKAYGGPVEATIHEFLAGDAGYRIPNRISLAVKGPNP